MDDITNTMYLVAALISASVLWGVILNGFRTTFLSRPAFPLMGWRFWTYGLLAWIAVGIAQLML